MHLVDEESREGLLLYTARSYRKPLQKLLMFTTYTIIHRKAIFIIPVQAPFPRYSLPRY